MMGYLLIIITHYHFHKLYLVDLFIAFPAPFLPAASWPQVSALSVVPETESVIFLRPVSNGRDKNLPPLQV